MTPYLDTSRLKTPEHIIFVAGPVLLVSLFLPWFSTSGNGQINGATGDFTAWETFGALKYYLLWCSLGCFILPWLIARRHELSWTPGEMTTVFGVVGVALVFCNGILFGRPGEPDGSIDLAYGFPIALAAVTALTVAGLLRVAQSPKARRPPGLATSRGA